MANEMESYPTTRAMKYKLDDLKQEGETYKDVVDRLLEMAAKPGTTRATAPLPKDEYDPADHVDATIKLSKAQKHALLLDEPGDTYKESMRYLLAMVEETDSGSPLQEPPFTDHPDAWYEPDTDNPDELVAVRVPDDAWGNATRTYFKTYEGAAKAITRWYDRLY